MVAPRTRSAGAGVTLPELLITVSIVVVVAALLLPALGMARSLADAAKCASNLRQIGIGVLAFADDREDKVPRVRNPNWETSVARYVETTRVGATSTLRRGVVNGCPRHARGKATTAIHATGYAFNCFLWRGEGGTADVQHNNFAETNWFGVRPVDFVLSGISHPSDRLLIADGQDWYVGNGFGNNVVERHRGRTNALFIDGHISAIDAAAAAEAITIRR